MQYAYSHTHTYIYILKVWCSYNPVFRGPLVDLCRPSPPPPPPLCVVATSVVADELWGQLLAREREMDNREGAITAREDGLASSNRALGRTCMDRDAACAQAEAAQHDYRARLHTSTSSSKHSINFNWMLKECQILLSCRR
jgi:hypothetical protein